MTARIVSRSMRALQRGVTLIEALAALAVMAFGLLGVVGMQATLRTNADVSKQRSEAVRLAQAQVENWRGFHQLDASAGVDYGDIADGTVVGNGTNAAFTIAATVGALPASAPAPKLKTVTIDVGWRDRTDQLNQFRLASAIAGIAPALSGALGLPTDRSVAQRPGGRHRAIPLGAVDIVGQGGMPTGTSTFVPPGATPGVSWTFDNTTGLIIDICTAPGTCLAGNHGLLSGFVRFATIVAPPAPATSATQPTGADSEVPAGAAFAVGVEVDATLPTTATVVCYTQPSSTHVAYYCAVPTTPTPPHRWSGQALLTGLPLSPAMADSTATNYKVCRYTPGATHTPTDNFEHPLVYTNVATPLAQQNYLVIHAGDGTTPFTCPGDGSSPFVNSFTYPHQPSS